MYAPPVRDIARPGLPGAPPVLHPVAAVAAQLPARVIPYPPVYRLVRYAHAPNGEVALYLSRRPFLLRQQAQILPHHTAVYAPVPEQVALAHKTFPLSLLRPWSGAERTEEGNCTSILNPHYISVH